MKKDTSNIVDLDSLFEVNNEHNMTNDVETVVSDYSHVNFAHILSECSYKLPKGYPTLVDGVFTEREEVIIINEALEAEGLPTLPLPEAKAIKDYPQAAKYVTSAISKLKSKNAIVVQPFIGKDGGVTVIRLEVDKADSRRLVAAELAKILKGKIGNKQENVKFVYNGVEYVCAVKQVSKETSTDTSVKEGLSVVMSYYPGYLTEFDENNITKDNYKEVSKNLISFINQKGVSGLSASVLESCRMFLQKGLTMQGKDIKTYVSILNQNSSHANTFDYFFQKNKNWYVERDQLFDEIRSVAHELSKTSTTKNGLPADKWCPGDVYFIKNGSEGLIRRTLEEAKKQPKPNGLAVINDLFSSKFSEPENNKCIVAVSLKMEKAQAGKLKSALEQYTNIKTDYVLDDRELKLSTVDLVNTATKLRKPLLAFTKSPEVDVVWDPCDLNKVKDVRTLRCKLAAYKALTFIYEKIADKKFDRLDDALVNLVVFGLGVIKNTPDVQLNKLQAINPPFFKAIASSSGNGVSKPILFKGDKLSIISLWDVTGKNDPKITITDNENYAGISIGLGVQVGDNKFNCLVAFRPNQPGSSQIVIELAKADHK
jgi:hypothetical protein